jgi:hypothetical protein
MRTASLALLAFAVMLGTAATEPGKPAACAPAALHFAGTSVAPTSPATAPVPPESAPLPWLAAGGGCQATPHNAYGEDASASVACQQAYAEAAALCQDYDQKPCCGESGCTCVAGGASYACSITFHYINPDHGGPA